MFRNQLSLPKLPKFTPTVIPIIKNNFSQDGSSMDIEETTQTFNHMITEIEGSSDDDKTCIDDDEEDDEYIDIENVSEDDDVKNVYEDEEYDDGEKYNEEPYESNEVKEPVDEISREIVDAFFGDKDLDKVKRSKAGLVYIYANYN